MRRNTNIFTVCRLLTAGVVLSVLAFSCSSPVTPQAVTPQAVAAKPDPYLQVRYDTIRVDPSTPSANSTLAQVRKSMNTEGIKRSLNSAEKSSSEDVLKKAFGGAVSTNVVMQSRSAAASSGSSLDNDDIRAFLNALEAYEWMEDSGKGIIVVALNPSLIKKSGLSSKAQLLLQSIGTRQRVIYKSVIGWQVRELPKDPSLQIKYDKIKAKYNGLINSGAKSLPQLIPLLTKVSGIQTIMGTPGARRALSSEERGRYKRDILNNLPSSLASKAGTFGSRDKIMDSLDSLFDSLIIYEWTASGRGMSVYFMDVSKALDALLPLLSKHMNSSVNPAILKQYINDFKRLFPEPVLIGAPLPIGWSPTN